MNSELEPDLVEGIPLDENVPLGDVPTAEATPIDGMMLGGAGEAAPAGCGTTSAPTCYAMCDKKCRESIANAKKVLREGGCPVEITLKKPGCGKKRKKAKKCYKTVRTPCCGKTRSKAKCCKGLPCGKACIPKTKKCHK